MTIRSKGDCHDNETKRPTACGSVLNIGCLVRHPAVHAGLRTHAIHRGVSDWGRSVCSRLRHDDNTKTCSEKVIANRTNGSWSIAAPLTGTFHPWSTGVFLARGTRM